MPEDLKKVYCVQKRRDCPVSKYGGVWRLLDEPEQHKVYEENVTVITSVNVAMI